MPVIAIVSAVKTQFFAKEHPPPHFHAEFAEYRAVIDIETLKVSRGGLPPSKLRDVLESAEPRKAALLQMWYLAIARKPLERLT